MVTSNTRPFCLVLLDVWWVFVILSMGVCNTTFRCLVFVGVCVCVVWVWVVVMVGGGGGGGGDGGCKRLFGGGQAKLLM